MSFLIIAIVSLIVLGIIAAIASRGDDQEIVTADTCAGCTGRAECKLADIMEKKQGKDNKTCHSAVNKE